MAVALLILMLIMVPTVDSFFCKVSSEVRQLQSEVETLKSKVAYIYSLKSIVDKLQTDLQATDTKIDRLEKLVVFRATFQNEILDVYQGTVKFDNVLENAGNGYNPSTGYFTAPVGGLYIFTVQAFSYVNGPLVDWDLYTLDSSKVEIQLLRSRGNVKEESTAYTYITSLQPGQIVFVRNLQTGGRFYGRRHSFFSGCLVKSF